MPDNDNFSWDGFPPVEEVISLFRQYVECDDDAARRLFDLYAQWLRRRARKALGAEDEHLLEDLVDDVFIRVKRWRRVPETKHGHRGVAAYLREILGNLIKNEIEKRQKRRGRGKQITLEQLEADVVRRWGKRQVEEYTEPEPSEVLDGEEKCRIRFRVLKSVLSGEKEKAQRAILFRYVEERNQAKVARALGLTEKEVSRYLIGIREKIPSVVRKRRYDEQGICPYAASDT